MASQAKCGSCNQREAVKTGILEGKFGGYCNVCWSGQDRVASGQSAEWHRDRDREDHRQDLVQPWLADGRPNREFHRLYPNEAKEMFSEEELQEM